MEAGVGVRFPYSFWYPGQEVFDPCTSLLASSMGLPLGGRASPQGGKLGLCSSSQHAVHRLCWPLEGVGPTWPGTVPNP